MVSLQCMSGASHPRIAQGGGLFLFFCFPWGRVGFCFSFIYIYIYTFEPGNIKHISK